MEPTSHPVTVFMGEYEVIEGKYPGAVTIHVGHNVHLTIHLGDMQHNHKPGDKLPLYTTIQAKSHA